MSNKVGSKRRCEVRPVQRKKGKVGKPYSCRFIRVVRRGDLRTDLADSPSVVILNI